MDNLPLYRFDCTAPYSYGCVLIAAKDIHQARELAKTSNNQGYMDEGRRFDHSTFTKGKPRIILDAMYIE
jgi:hypothetical protein